MACGEVQVRPEIREGTVFSELLLCVLGLFFGLLLLGPEHTLGRPGSVLVIIERIASEGVWGVYYVVISVFGLVALERRNRYARATASAIACLSYGSIATALCLHRDYGSVALVFFGVFALFAWIHMYRNLRTSWFSVYRVLRRVAAQCARQDL